MARGNSHRMTFKSLTGNIYSFQFSLTIFGKPKERCSSWKKWEILCNPDNLIRETKIRFKSIPASEQFALPIAPSQAISCLSAYFLLPSRVKIACNTNDFNQSIDEQTGNIFCLQCLFINGIEQFVCLSTQFCCWC